MDHWTAKAALGGFTYDSVWNARTDRSAGTRAARAETKTRNTQWRARFASRRAHARPAVGARA